MQVPDASVSTHLAFLIAFFGCAQNGHIEAIRQGRRYYLLRHCCLAEGPVQLVEGIACAFTSTSWSRPTLPNMSKMDSFVRWQLHQEEKMQTPSGCFTPEAVQPETGVANRPGLWAGCRMLAGQCLPVPFVEMFIRTCR